jgi:hypothetical protein
LSKRNKSIENDESMVKKNPKVCTNNSTTQTTDKGVTRTPIQNLLVNSETVGTQDEDKQSNNNNKIPQTTNIENYKDEQQYE